MTSNLESCSKQSRAKMRTLAKDRINAVDFARSAEHTMINQPDKQQLFE
jgi:hypothetical protein